MGGGSSLGPLGVKNKVSKNFGGGVTDFWGGVSPPQMGLQETPGGATGAARNQPRLEIGRRSKSAARNYFFYRAYLSKDQWRGVDTQLSRAKSLFCRGSLPTWGLARNRPPVKPTDQTAFLAFSQCKLSYGRPISTRDQFRYTPQLGGVAVALAPQVRRLNRRMASSGEPSTYLFILKHVSDSHQLLDDI